MTDFGTILGDFFGGSKKAAPNALAERQYTDGKGTDAPAYRIPELGITIKEFKDGVDPLESNKTRFIIEVGGNKDDNLKAMGIDRIDVSSAKLTVRHLNGTAKDIPFDHAKSDRQFQIDVRNLRDAGVVNLKLLNPEGADIRLGLGKVASAKNSFIVDLSEASKVAIDQFEGNGNVTVTGLSTAQAGAVKTALAAGKGSRTEVPGMDGVKIENTQGTIETADPAKAAPPAKAKGREK